MLLILLGTIGAIGDGLSTNCLLVFASRLMNSLGHGKTQQNQGNFLSEVEKCSLYFVYLGLAVMVVAFMEGYCWSKTSERQVLKIRYKYLEAVLRQEVGFFDSQEATTSEIINGISKDTSLIQEVLSAKKAHKEYGKANAIVEQALSSIKTVYSFTAEKRITDRYSAILDRTSKLGIKQGIAKGLAVGSTGLSFAIWAFLAWYGSHLVMYKGESGGRINAAGISFILGGLSLGMALPDLKYFTEASVAATRIFHRINRVPEIDGEDAKGLVLDKYKAKLNSNKSNSHTHLAQISLSSKTSASKLKQDKQIDGADIKTMNLKWIRGKMGLVSQEHALFGTSIKDNIMFGKLDATMDEVTAAATAANAHNFIRQLPEGYETKVGERGALLSAGQKQRIAIARAIIKNPVILLLDEATSALDSESESLVQKALDQASMGRTTLVIAHKLSTIRNADLVAVVNNGCIIEIGSHNDLINIKNGHYAKLTKLQAQFSCDDQEENPDQARFSSVSRSSPGQISTGRSSPAIFDSPLPVFDSTKPVSHPPPSFSRLVFLNLPEWKQGLVGSLSAVVFGAVQPVYALTMGGMIAAFFAPSHEEVHTRIRTYSLIFCSLSLISITVNLVQHYNFAYMGETLTKRIRLRMLEKILTFEAAWFDEDQNSSGALCSRLSNEASMVKSLVADRVSLLVQTTSAVTIAMIMGLVVAWKLALVMIAVQPLTILCYYTRKVLLSSITANFVEAQNHSSQIAAEAVYNHRIVTSFGSVEKVLQLFDEAQEEPRKEARKKSWLAGIGMGSAQCLTFTSWALDFWLEEL
ncbi:hypothetical protein GH714_038996 [Hevea brasiliensis]|uniref:ABC transmembrane type-1 domain-containing protein n=1 Tax=Hevea brasiliensis TaxID=3981 RepID=A0A6A6KAN3_HEVBR|nr:hypothetical protein GH714_038996 [Hevea brasiliensis]